jgi:AbrB family looped-hinge helix DNA binding protein
MRVTEKGQVTIPLEMREKHGIRPGSEVEFADGGNPGEVVIKIKTAARTDRRAAFRAWLDSIEGTADAGLTADQVLDMTRGPDRRE